MITVCGSLTYIYFNMHDALLIHSKLESTQRVQTPACDYVLIHKLKLIYDIEIKLITEVISLAS